MLTRRGAGKDVCPPTVWTNRAEVAVNAESRHIGTTRSNGVLVNLTSPSGGLISGLAAAMNLDGWTWEEMVLKAPAALIVNWPNAGSDDYKDDVAELEGIFDTARAYGARKEKGDASTFRTDPRWDAMQPVFGGDLAVIVDADDVTQMRDAMAWAKKDSTVSTSEVTMLVRSPERRDRR